MYTTYITDAIVIQRRGIGEADSDITLYTKDFGLIHAKATGLRLEKSKLRFALQTLNLDRLSLVRGVRGWRLVGAEVIQTINLTKDKVVAARVLDLIIRFVKGSEKDERLFAFLTNLFVPQSEDLKNRELILVSGILACLGYIPVLNSEDEDLYYYLQEQSESDKQGLLKMVNDALRDSHL